MHSAYPIPSKAEPLPTELHDIAVDPYLLWARATDWAEFGATPPSMLLVAIELADGKAGTDLRAAAFSVGWDDADLRVPPVWERRRLVTAQVSMRFLSDWPAKPALRACVKRLEMGLPLAGPAVPLGPPPAPPTGRPNSALLGIIDHGFAFAHPDFTRRTAGGARLSRIRTLWDQDTDGHALGAALGAVPPPAVGYGRELSFGAIDALLAAHPHDEAASYESAGYHALRVRATHGTHVASLAGGRLSARHRLRFGVEATASSLAVGAADPAADTDLALVQLPRAAVRDSSGRWLEPAVLNGVQHILSAARPGQRVVVNISYGSRLGPHDGTSLVESGLAALLQEVNRKSHRLDIVLPAGNAFAQRAHAALTLLPKGEAGFDWHVAAGSEATTFAELWIPAGVDPLGVELSLTPPAATGEPPLTVRGGQWQGQLDASGRPTAMVVFPEKSSLGLNGTLVLLAVGPTWQRGSAGARSHAGRWRVSLHWPGGHESMAAMQAHAYLARNDADYGMPLRGRPSHFVGGAAYDPARHLRRAVDDTVPPVSTVQRLGTLAWNLAADGAHVVAGHVDRPYAPSTSPAAVQSLRAHAPYSGAGPARAPSSRRGPTLSLPVDGSPLWRGLRAAGTRGHAVVRLVGTSAAAPQWARFLVNWGRPVGPEPTQAAHGAGRDQVLFGSKRREPI